MVGYREMDVSLVEQPAKTQEQRNTLDGRKVCADSEYVGYTRRVILEHAAYHAVCHFQAAIWMRNDALDYIIA